MMRQPTAPSKLVQLLEAAKDRGQFQSQAMIAKNSGIAEAIRIVCAYEASRQDKQPEVGDMVSFFVRAHPIMGEPYEVAGRVQSDARGLYAGGRYLYSAVSEITIWEQKNG